MHQFVTKGVFFFFIGGSVSASRASELSIPILRRGSEPYEKIIIEDAFR